MLGLAVQLARSADPRPGLRDPELMFQVGRATFTGPFHMLGGRLVEYTRPVRVLLAVREVVVLQDVEHDNLYVVDRLKRVSLGSRMSTTLTVEGRRVV